MTERTKQKADRVIHHAAQLVTARGFSHRPKLGDEMKELGILTDGSLAIDQEEIIWVGPASRIFQEVELRKNGVILEATGKTVLPGLIDTHNHLVFAGCRENEFIQRVNEGLSYLEIAQRGGGVMQTVAATRSASFEELFALSEKRTRQMISRGTTTSEAKSGYGLNCADEKKSLQVIRSLNRLGPLTLKPTLLIHGVPPEWQGKEEAYIEMVIQEMIPEIAGEGLADFCDIAFAPGRVFSECQSEKILKKAKDFGLKTRIHADEFSCDRGAEFAAEIGAHSVDHCIHSSDEGIQALRESKVIANLMPAVPFNHRMKKYAQARKMIDSGVAVALGTDYNPSCFSHSMLLAITLACLYMNMTPSEAINAATINAAHSIGEARNRGSLEEGKKADLLIVDAPNHIHLPYSLGSNLIDKILKDGKLWTAL